MPAIMEAVYRILDANLNRTREALRVIEDHARFGCNDAAAAAEVKSLRHALRTLVARCGPERLLAARDILQDVGTDVKTAAELERKTTTDVVRAAFLRLQEATRTLGEYAKLVDAEAAAAAEKLRYAAYALEQTVVLRGPARGRLRQAKLYLLLTEAYCQAPWEQVVERSLAAGVDIVQLREKSLPDGELLRRAERLRRLTRDHDALLFINDRPDVARLCQADGVHVGQDDLSVANIRRIGGADLLVGKSTHTPEQFDAALAESPDYLAVGPMFPSSTKPQEHIAGPETLRRIRGRTELPLVAIGAIDADNANAVRDAGGDILAVCSAILGANDPTAATRALLSGS
jgi:thiamine-phosphate pyrophosphorylase